ncbi:Subtilisin-like protease [Abeliophyllum distichum]|uniref:Subtilisin-like protease n=1 Tax=Abeliophyllum distichum TaxID=126358 RepID=A0ABD1RBD3_9LAMI
MRKERQKAQAACWLQLSMFQTCKMTHDGDLTHDMKAIQKQRPLQAQQYSESGTTSLVRTTPFDFGSGHINPRAALDPRLIFDALLAGGRRKCRRLSPELEKVIAGGGKLVERKYG